MKVSCWQTAFLLLVNAVSQTRAAEGPSVQQIVSTRLIAGFKEGCNVQETAIRSLGSAIKMAYMVMRRKQGKRTEAMQSTVMDITHTSSEEYTTYSRRKTSFNIYSASDVDNNNDMLYGSSHDAHDDSSRCSITNLHLKKVGVSVLSVADCPVIATDMDAAISAFQHDQCVAFIERDSVVSLYPTYEGPPVDNHPEQPEEDNKPKDAPLAYWLEVAGVSRAWQDNTCVRDVVVGVIDTGVAVDHPDLRANIWQNEYEIAGNGIDDDRNGYIDDINGFDFYLKKAAVTDAHGHGTHCAGIIGATPTMTTAQGVCKTVSIAGLRFLDAQGSGATSDSIEAINYAIEMDFHMTSNSWGGPDVSSGLLQAIKRAADIEQLFVAAAGNSGNNADIRPEYPGAYKVDNVISVAATDESDKLANFSNYGRNAVHIAAPGVFILSTFPPATVKSLSGTSMATPVISGVAAMLLSIRPMRVAEVKRLIFSTADSPRSLKGKLRTEGRVNAAFAICSASLEGWRTKKEGRPRSVFTRRLKRAKI